jgi:nucleotide-binding universal stress UspA family protein
MAWSLAPIGLSLSRGNPREERSPSESGRRFGKAAREKHSYDTWEGRTVFKKILCAVDGSDHAWKALAFAIDMAKIYDAKLVLLHNMLLKADSAELQRFAEVEGLAKSVQPEVARLKALEGRLEYGYEEPPAETPRMYAEIGQKILDEAKTEASENGLKDVETVLTDGDAASRILRCVDERDVDCVVMGSRGLSDIKALYLGSVSHKVLNKAPCTCITVK